MKFSRQKLLKLKTKKKKLTSNKYKKLKSYVLHKKFLGTSMRPRLSVYRSNKNIYAQLIDDTEAKTLLACSTLFRQIKLKSTKSQTCDAAFLTGQELAKLSLQKKINRIIFDRGPYLFHGRIKALADGIKLGGLKI